MSSWKRWITVEPAVILIGASQGPLALLGLPLYFEETLANQRNFTLIKDDSVNGTCNDPNANTSVDYQIQQEIAAETATLAMIGTVLGFAPAVFISPFLGALSDRLGRRLNLQIPILGFFFWQLAVVISMYVHLPLWVISMWSIFVGLGGGYTFLLSGCYAYISDLVGKEQSRLLRFSVVRAVFEVSLGFMQIPAAYFIEQYGFIPYVWLNIAMSIAALLYISFSPCFTPSSQAFSCSSKENRLNVEKVFSDVKQLFQDNTDKRRFRLGLFFLIYFVTDLIQLSLGSTQIFILYGLGPPFCWSSATAAIFTLILQCFSSFGEYNK